MTYKEIEKIAKKYGWTTTSAATLYRIEKEYGDSTTNYIVIGKFNRNVIFLKNERCNPGNLIVIKSAMELAETPLGEREEEKIYIIPLPHLVTSDGKKQYLTQLGTFFACRRDKTLIQTWEEKDLVHVPEEYRGFAVEIEVEE